MLAERSPCAVKGCVPASGSTCWANEAHPNVRNRLARNQRCIRRNWFGRSLAQRTLESRQQPARGRDWAHLTFVEPARGVAQISNLSASPGIASFGEVFQALAVARSVWSAWSLLPLSSLQPPTKAPASWTHQTLREVRWRLCRLCRAALYRRFPIRRLGNVPNAGKSGSPAGWELCDTADWKSIGNLRYIDHFDKAEMRALSSASSQFA